MSDKLRWMVEAFPVVVVNGARQVGKTTLVRHLFPQFDYVVFDPTIDPQNHRRTPLVGTGSVSPRWEAGG